MTHEELLQKINEMQYEDYKGIGAIPDWPYQVIHAVVELAITAVNGNPNTAYSMGYAAACERIIQAIEKELN